jgi:hypothetical protein
MECPTAQNLLAAYTAAAREHVEAVNHLTDLLELASTDKLAESKRQTEQTSAKCRAAHVALEMHHAEHRCGSNEK